MQFPQFSSACSDILVWNFTHECTTEFECCHHASIFEGVIPLCELRILGNTEFSAFFSFLLWDVELKFCTWLCFNVLQIKFKLVSSLCIHLALLLSIIFLNLPRICINNWAEILNFTWFLKCVSCTKALYKKTLLKCSWRTYYAPFAVLRYIWRSYASFRT